MTERYRPRLTGDEMETIRTALQVFLKIGPADRETPSGLSMRSVAKHLLESHFRWRPYYVKKTPETRVRLSPADLLWQAEK